MNNTIFKKIRLGVVILCLTLIVAVCAPAMASAETDSAATEHDSVHFINPTAITIVGSKLYVADVVEDNKSALLCFDISESTPVLKYTYDKIDGVVSGLTSDKQGVIYLNMSNKVVELNVSGDESPTIGKTYAMPQASTASIVDIAYGKIINLSDKTLYVLTETALYQYNEASQLFDIELVSSLSGAKATLSIDEAPNYQLYYLSGDNTTICNRMNLSNGTQDSTFATKLSLTGGFVPTGMLRINNYVALYNSDAIYVIEEITTLASTTPLLTLSDLYKSDCRICDVEAYGDRLFILNSKNKIDIFDKTEDVYNNQPTTTIGSDMVDKDVPTAYTSFTLVRPNGYPANIVYKTNAETSVEDIITDATEYVILGYDGDQNSHYYYVMVGDKFGWVKKSDEATSPTDDSKLTVVNNTPNGEEGFEGETELKFNSLFGVWVYELPLTSAQYTVIHQTALTMKDAHVMQVFKEGEITWCYIRYDGDKTGFVQESSLGDIHIVATTKPDYIGLRKINSSLFAPVDVYEDKEMQKLAKDASGNVIKLYSGDAVTLLKTEGDLAFIEIVHNNGSVDYGWIDASRLIDRYHITTNAIVGLSMLAVAIVLTVVLLIVYFKRKKKIKRNND